MNNTEIFIPIRIPRWDELPEIELYMDQVVGFISRKLSLCFGADDDKSITATMVNNYVKQKLIASPQKKKYNRTQMAQLIIIFLMKKIFSIPEIGDFLSYLTHLSDMPAAYDLFGDTLYAMSTTPPTSPEVALPALQADEVICSSIRALCARLYAHRILESAVSEFTPRCEKVKSAPKSKAKSPEKAKEHSPDFTDDKADKAVSPDGDMPDTNEVLNTEI